jgi:RNA polymerase II elongation factor ELL
MTQAEQESKKSCAQEIKPRGTKGGSIIKRKVPSALPASLTQSRPPHKQTLSPSQPTRPLAPSTAQRHTPNPAVMGMPFKDRLVHLLAIRPYKKPELLARLQKDGLRDRDRQSMAPMLKQVAQFNPRDNTYSLLKHLFQEVKEDWPFYTETDRQLLKRRKANSSSPAALSPAHSPAQRVNVNLNGPVVPSAANPPSQPQTQKRTPPAPVDQPQPPIKRQRVTPPAINGDPKKNDPKTDPSAPKVNKVSNANGGSGSTGSLAFSKEKLKLDSPNSLGESQENNNYLGDNSPDKHAPDFVRQYPMIRSNEQRQKYKRDFNAEYEEYRQLHAEIEQVSNMFRSLVEKIQHEEKGSEEYENMKSHIYNEYSHVKKDPKYIAQRKRCDYLYKKLGHIKKQITEYDLLTPSS